MKDAIQSERKYQDSVLEACKVDTGYRHGVRETITISKGLSAHLFSGEVVGLIGPNGCGKSTFLRSLCGLQPILQGSIYIGAKEIAHMSPIQLARKVSVVLTGRVQAGHLKSETIVSLGRYPHSKFSGRMSEHDREVVQSAFKAVNAETLQHRTVDELSDGELQKVMVARALAQEPHIMLLDEPTVFLDVTRKIEVMELLRHISRTKGTAIVVSSHDLDLLMRISDRVWLMDENGNLHKGAPDDSEFTSLVRTIFHIPDHYSSL